MPRLFSYRSLQHEEVQVSTFGRKLDGEKDLLIGYEPSLVKIPDPELAKRLKKLHHDNVKKTDDDWSNVPGHRLRGDRRGARTRPTRSKRSSSTSVSTCPSRPAKRRGCTCTSRVPEVPRVPGASCSASTLPIIQAPMAACRGARWRSRCPTRAGSDRCRARCSRGCDAQRAVGDRRGHRQAVQRQLLLPRAAAAGSRARGRVAHVLAPYYEESASIPTTIPAGRRARRSRRRRRRARGFKPPVVSFHFGLPAADLLQRVRAGARRSCRRRRPSTRRGGSRRTAPTRSSRRGSRPAGIAACSCPTT